MPRILNKRYWPYSVAIDSNNGHTSNRSESAERNANIVDFLNSAVSEKHWHRVGNVFYFKNKADAVMFKLKQT